MTRFIVTNDLHFTNDPNDAYRLGILPWLAKKAVKLKADYVFILGDITDLKDNHPSILVNKIVDGLQNIAQHTQVIILVGNHDYKDKEWPFFRFMEYVNNVQFIKEPLLIIEPGFEVLLLPHSKDPLVEWKTWKLNNFDYILMHQTMEGSLASNGQKMEGLTTKFFKNTKARILSGDIHVPQDIGPVTYIGAPYRIHFGDKFEPRALYINSATGKEKDLHYPCLKKHTVYIKKPEELKDLDIAERDYVKVRLVIPKSMFVEWSNLRQEIREVCDDMKIRCFGVEVEELIKRKRIEKDKDKDSSQKAITDKEILRSYCTDEKVGKFVQDAGEELLDAI